MVVLLCLQLLKISNIFKSKQVEVHSSFLETVNLELRLAADFQPHLFLIFVKF